MSKPITIGATVGAREARAHRAAERWASEHAPDATPELLQVLEAKCAASAAALERDLHHGEVESICTSAARAYEDEEQQRLAQESIESAREAEAERAERERLAFIRRRMVPSGELTPDPARNAPCLRLDALGKREAARPQPRRIDGDTPWGKQSS